MACWSPPELRANKTQKELTLHEKILKDIPLTAGNWISATHDKTDSEIRGTVPVQKHPVARYIATKPASQLGGPTLFSSGELLRNSKHLDPSSLLSEKKMVGDGARKSLRPSVVQRMVVEHSMQACPPAINSGTQTLRFGPVNACSQYEAQGSGRTTTKAHSVGAGNSKAALRDFLEKPEISFAIEEALQQNETIDVFARDFDKLGVDDTRMAMLDASLVSGTEAGITECRNFHDVAYTKNKRVECIHWVPEESDVIAASYLENLTYGQRLDTMGKASLPLAGSRGECSNSRLPITRQPCASGNRFFPQPRPSCVLLWSFHDPLAPHAALLSPNEVVTFSFCPTDRRFVVGALITGQMVLWRVTDQELGLSAAKRGKVARKKRDKDSSKEEGGKSEKKKKSTGTKTRSVLRIKHKLVSTIDDSHKRACRSIAWLPHWVDVERKGKCVDRREKELDDDDDASEKAKFFVTIAGDGQVLLWDFQTARDAVVRGEHDFTWRPIHSIQLQRQDSGTEMGCTHILPLVSMNLTHKPQEDHESASLSNFFATTEEGELIYGDWAAKASGDKKPEFVKSLCDANKTFRPLLQLSDSDRIRDLMLVVSDWEFALWYIGGAAPSLARPDTADPDDEEDEVDSPRPDKFMPAQIHEPLFRSTAPNSYFACGTCSPSRPAVRLAGHGETGSARAVSASPCGLAAQWKNSVLL
ncbi:WD repeat domain 63 [Perkinsus olseni]|uniref:WD repeat domain 63 n=1 Tax=Perkinsus olseni TaxID=32597 RepID=A0A7J6L6J1_PEROL|nr:WD repeat domain 63 [Perkinsus olseni]